MVSKRKLSLQDGEIYKGKKEVGDEKSLQRYTKLWTRIFLV